MECCRMGRESREMIKTWSQYIRCCCHHLNMSPWLTPNIHVNKREAEHSSWLPVNETTASISDSWRRISMLISFCDTASCKMFTQTFQLMQMLSRVDSCPPARICAYLRLCADFVCNRGAWKMCFVWSEHILRPEGGNSQILYLCKSTNITL